MNEEFLQALGNVSLEYDLLKNREIEKMQSEYYALLGRIKKAEEYMDNAKIPYIEREKAASLFIAIARRAAKLLKKLRQLGIQCEEPENTDLGVIIDEI